MMPILCALVALLSLASATPFQSRTSRNGSDETAIEILYPRNETYKLASPLPIVLGVANLPPTAVLGNYTLQWALTGFSAEDIPGGLIYGQGMFWPRNETAPSGNQPLIFADFVDLNEQFKHQQYDFRGRLELSVYLSYNDSQAENDVCRARDNGNSLGPFTDVATVGFRLDEGDGGKFQNTDAVNIDLRQATGCPAVGAGVAVTTTTPSVTLASGTPPGSTCLQPLVTSTPTQRSECPFTVDASMASSISSSVSVLMIPPPTESLPTYTSNRAAKIPIQTGGLAAAAGIAGAMMLL
ncbi:hypothetical protein LEL_05641 [Akanthomyces lecanii RCEF 1005]|uniref:DUF7136 domain-containing protein n=1 Tax=Akanthomyces lecanii RCEF 1005 TaxID=1081108 RepID=A0A168G350_CORDF|nr:hypothetical protein LEL_05641 [Akanthomyces lecanii RCEF 1005]